MAKIHAQVVGGSVKEYEVQTVGELKTLLGIASHTATVNGEPQDDSYNLSDFEFVSLAASVKGAIRLYLAYTGLLHNGMII